MATVAGAAVGTAAAARPLNAWGAIRVSCSDAGSSCPGHESPRLPAEARMRGDLPPGLISPRASIDGAYLPYPDILWNPP
jgi:hypothetical protein